jgi:hypothetical protein
MGSGRRLPLRRPFGFDFPRLSEAWKRGRWLQGPTAAALVFGVHFSDRGSGMLGVLSWFSTAKGFGWIESADIARAFLFTRLIYLVNLGNEASGQPMSATKSNLTWKSKRGGVFERGL